MSEPEASARREIAAKDVFVRSNMPSRWERLTGIAPKTAADRKYLAFVAARYRGDERLPHPDKLDVPSEVQFREHTLQGGWWFVSIAVAATAIGLSAELTAVAAVAIVLLVCALGAIFLVRQSTEPIMRQHQALKARCETAERRLHASSLDPADADTLNTMINCDEGTLTYCAAKIASEIEQDSAWDANAVGFVQIDLWDELAEIGASARQIATDRAETEALERGHLRDDPEIRAVIAEEKQQRKEAITLLAARVHALANYRDRVHRHGVLARREHGTVDRIVRKVVDEQASDRLR